LFIRDTIVGELFCDPYRPQILIALAQVNTYESLAQCTLLDAVDNIDAFLDDFSYGGWEGWIQLTQQPQNNIYGSYLIAVDERDRRLAQALGNKSGEINQNQGFISLKRCAIYDSTYEFDPANYLENLDDFGGIPAFTDGIEGCLQTETITPGQAIVGRLNDALGAPLSRLGKADEALEAALSNILNALMNQLVLGGLRSLSGGGGGVNGTGPNLYLDSFGDDKDELLRTIDETIRETAIVADLYETIIRILKKYSELHTCYDEQKATISLQRFNPPNNFVAPRVPDISARQEEIVGLSKDAESLISQVTGHGTLTQSRKFNDLKRRINLADEAGQINPTTIAEFWIEFNEIRQDVDLQERANDLERGEQLAGELASITLELENCEKTLVKLKGWVGGSKTVPVNVQNWPEGIGN